MVAPLPMGPMPPGMQPGPGMVPPGPGLGMPQPMMPDPLAAMMMPDPMGGMGGLGGLLDPNILASLLPPVEYKPKRAAWQKPSKPKPEVALAKAQKDQKDWAGLLSRFSEDLDRLSMEKGRHLFGVFDDFDETAEHPWWSSALADEDQLIQALLGTLEPHRTSVRRTPADDDEAQAKEDFLHCLWEEFRRDHIDAGNGELQIEIVKTINGYGRVCAFQGIDLDGEGERIPVVRRLIDPATAFPTFEGRRGMKTMTRVYMDTVANLVGDHDDAKETIEKKLIKGRDDNGRWADKYQWEDSVEIIEYWDRRWWCLWAAGRLIKGPLEHNYGEVPFVYTLAPYGDASYTQHPNRRTLQRNKATLSATQADIASRGLSPFHTRWIPHAQREAMFSRLMTRLAAWGNEPIVVAQDEFAREAKGDLEVSGAPGAKTKILLGHEELRPYPQTPTPPQLAPLMAASNEDVNRAALPPSTFGITPAQTSGFAVNGLDEIGSQKIAPIRWTYETFIRQLDEQALRFYGDFGDLLGKDGMRGTLYIPRQMPRPGESDLWEITPEMVRRTGWRVDVSLFGVKMSALGPAANALSIIKREGWISSRDAMRLLNLPGARNPEQAMKEIRVEKIEEMPEYLLADMLKYVVEEKNNPTLAEFIYKQLMMGRMKEQQAMGGGGAPGGAPPSNVQVQGASLPGMNMPPGQMGGRPPGPPPGMPPGPMGPGLEP